MGYLQETPSWDEGVPYFAADAILTGGPDCPDNIPIQALTNRTAYLKGLVEEVGAGSVRLAGDQRIEGRKEFAESPAAPTPSQFDAGVSSATTAFVQRALGSRSGCVTYTASRTLNASHVGGYVRFNVTAPATCVLPAPNSVPPGSSIIVQQAVSSAGALTIATASGAIGGPGVNGAGGIASLVMQAALVAQIEFVSDGESSWFACNGSYGASMASSGYQRLPSGLIIQWGIAAAMSANETRAVTLPVSFPSGAKSVVLTADGATPSVRIAALGTSTFQIQNLGTAAQNAYWQAIGY
ncbi:hypothetical protein [Microvirgula aerodenitrificans]|uniref:gp53-like domain-containing protein n=1 Tax=Microvirgula aerodenitrificans TaxID=57480 RepID=UPI0028E8F36C|nr:hypothetical protein [Microvirgula aerodenitrificans]